MKRRFTEKSVLYVFGLLGIIHETLVADIERPTLLLAFLAMIGLPTFLPSKDGPKVPPS